jgi:hypothetical protein
MSPASRYLINPVLFLFAVSWSVSCVALRYGGDRVSVDVHSTSSQQDPTHNDDDFSYLLQHVRTHRMMSNPTEARLLPGMAHKLLKQPPRTIKTSRWNKTSTIEHTQQDVQKNSKGGELIVPPRTGSVFEGVMHPTKSIGNKTQYQTQPGQLLDNDSTKDDLWLLRQIEQKQNGHPVLDELRQWLLSLFTKTGKQPPSRLKEARNRISWSEGKQTNDSILTSKVPVLSSLVASFTGELSNRILYSLCTPRLYSSCFIFTDSLLELRIT